MLAIFCLRLSFGLAGALLLLSPAQVAPRFYRTQFLTILGLITAAEIVGSILPTPVTMILVAALFLAFLGSVVWSLKGAPGGRALIVLTMLAVAAARAFWVMEWPSGTADAEGVVSAHPLPLEVCWVLADDLTAAALLGTATSAMLMGHSYLVAPAMSITPLLRLLAALFLATLLRMAMAGFGLAWFWAATDPPVVLGYNDRVLWLPVRWGLGFAAPLILGWMAWQSARIRSTQSATGILYVAVVFCFLGELTSQLLR